MAVVALKPKLGFRQCRADDVIVRILRVGEDHFAARRHVALVQLLHAVHHVLHRDGGLRLGNSGGPLHYLGWSIFLIIPMGDIIL